MVNFWVPEGIRSLRGVTQDEADEALASERRWPRPAHGYGIPVLTIWARTASGRPLVVVIRRIGPLAQEIVGAWSMSSTELSEFET